MTLEEFVDEYNLQLVVKQYFEPTPKPKAKHCVSVRWTCTIVSHEPDQDVLYKPKESISEKMRSVAQLVGHGRTDRRARSAFAERLCGAMLLIGSQMIQAPSHFE